jgi:hypothetical protein
LWNWQHHRILYNSMSLRLDQHEVMAIKHFWMPRSSDLREAAVMKAEHSFGMVMPESMAHILSHHFLIFASITCKLGCTWWVSGSGLPHRLVFHFDSKSVSRGETFESPCHISYSGMILWEKCGSRS